MKTVSSELRLGAAFQVSKARAFSLSAHSSLGMMNVRGRAYHFVLVHAQVVRTIVYSMCVNSSGFRESRGCKLRMNMVITKRTCESTGQVQVGKILSEEVEDTSRYKISDTFNVSTTKN